jgi:hypothetical protein
MHERGRLAGLSRRLTGLIAHFGRRDLSRACEK